jgi:hypothetical protein
MHFNGIVVAMECSVFRVLIARFMLVTLKMEMTYSPPKLAEFQWSIWCYIPEDVTLHALHL